MSNELIQWPRAKFWDKCWNPIIGCKPCSPACEHCYAAAWAERFWQSFEPHPSKDTRPPRSGVVFCGNMTDLFGEWTFGTQLLPEFVIRDAIGRTHTEATYLWLTKRIKRMYSAVGNAFDSEWRKTRRFYHYFGFTAENQEWFDKRRKAAYHIVPPNINTWLSAEPLLGEIDNLFLGNFVAGNRLKWCVVGCESGPNRRPCKIEWVESIVEQCMAAKVPVFVKQLDINGRCETDINKFPAHLQIRQVPWKTTQGKPK